MATFKTHVALRVTDLNRSVAFYRAMFGAEPVKYKSDYAKFDLDNPGLNLTLNVADEIVNRPAQGAIADHGALSHLGIQVDSRDALTAAIERFKTAGLSTFEEKDTDCCYALQDKVWVTDPDQNRWEIFVVKVADTSPEINFSTDGVPAQKQGCCA